MKLTHLFANLIAAFTGGIALGPQGVTLSVADLPGLFPRIFPSLPGLFPSLSGTFGDRIA